eukprot:TRINITY_DN4079_c0_g1_i1.p1 TRINITY_DN4079_c0_g1~~TRINITY_DN4079_c0_g1_i1.p1  ORF type:complete len:152 (+),score=38.73 TRINITY_DN4079_c0_g1_i1:38-493(+)
MGNLTAAQKPATHTEIKSTQQVDAENLPINSQAPLTPVATNKILLVDPRSPGAKRTPLSEREAREARERNTPTSQKKGRRNSTQVPRKLQFTNGTPTRPRYASMNGVPASADPENYAIYYDSPQKSLGKGDFGTADYMIETHSSTKMLAQI